LKAYRTPFSQVHPEHSTKNESPTGINEKKILKESNSHFEKSNGKGKRMPPNKEAKPIALEIPK